MGVDALDQFLDRLRLITRRDIVGDELERLHRQLLGGADCAFLDDGI